MMQRLSKSQTIVLVAVFASLMMVWVQQISGSTIKADALATLIPAVNLQHHGAYSLQRSGPRTPTMYREPVPVVVTAAGVALIDAALGPAEIPAYVSGERARLLKLQNLFWLTLLCAALFLATFHATGAFAVSTLVAVVGQAIFLHPGMRTTGIDSLYTEISAAALLVLGAWCYAVGVTRHVLKALAAAGVVFALLALTKASMLYIFVGLVVGLMCFRWLRRSTTLRSTAREVGVLALSFAVVVGPWMYRNWVQFHTLALSERGGLVLYCRAVYNEVTAVEYRGLFYVWAPRPIRAAVGQLLGFTPQDLDRGGALFRLNIRTDSPYAAQNVAAERAGRPQDATSLMAAARAERVKTRNAFQAAGFGHRSNMAADDFLKERALGMMRDNPGGALALTFAVLWRGGILLLPLLAGAFIYAWRRQRDDLLALCLPALGLTLFYAFFTVFEPRYGVPMTPLACVAAALVIFDAFMLSRSSRRTRAVQPVRHPAAG